MSKNTAGTATGEGKRLQGGGTGERQQGGGGKGGGEPAGKGGGEGYKEGEEGGGIFKVLPQTLFSYLLGSIIISPICKPCSLASLVGITICSSHL